ncbi:MAG TPA: VOC family protein [Candidatus Binataceae bacterium]|nr:VOC family protein [Candidatus Binataceae bacterium]
MLKGIDHIVVVVPDLEAAIGSYGELGFTVVRGGKHNIGTHNALIAFADGSYIELIAFLAPVAGHPWYDAMSKSGGLVDFCARADDLGDAVAAYRRAGVTVSDPNGMTRDRPDGYRLSWVLAIPNAPFNGNLPFLIKDETPRDERVPRERTHPNGVSGLSNLVVAVPDAAKTAGWYRIILGSAGENIEHRDLDAAGSRFQLGSHQLDIVSPRGPNGPVAEFLRTRNAGLYRATLNGGRAGDLDPALTQKARLRIE